MNYNNIHIQFHMFNTATVLKINNYRFILTHSVTNTSDYFSFHLFLRWF